MRPARVPLPGEQFGHMVNEHCKSRPPIRFSIAGRELALEKHPRGPEVANF